MAFCNSCGTSLTPGTRFCGKCGAAVLVSSAVAAGTPPAAAPSTVPAPVPATNAKQGGGALKVILIVVGVFVLLGILGVASVGFVAWRVARHSHVRQEGGNVKVETPFGSVETTQDPAVAARDLGVDLYPGAEVMKDGSSSATFGGVHSATVSAESSDSVDKVASFYKAKFPNAMVSSTDAGRCTIISNSQKGMVTVNIEAEGDKTKIQISNVSHKSGTSDSSSN
jgi:hypothetical protein